MTRIWLFALLIALILAAAYWWVFAKPAVNRKAQLVLRDRTFDIEVAETMAARAQGLSGRESLPEDSGLLFVFPRPGNHGFWMKDMKFPIDILWFRGNELVGIEKNAQPQPDATVLGLKVFYPPGEVDRVLEINAGLSDRYGFAPGDKFELRNFEIDPARITRADGGTPGR